MTSDPFSNFRGSRFRGTDLSGDPGATPRAIPSGDTIAPQLVPLGFNGADVFDSTDTMDVLIYVPSRVYKIIEARAILNFRQFFAPATAASTSGDLTTSSGGGSTSGASSASSSASGGSSSPTSGASSASTTASAGHTHVWASDLGAGSSGSSRIYATSPAINITIPADNAGDLSTFDEQPNHTHGMAHTHTVTIGGHTHGIEHTHTTPNHQHTTPAHTHALTYGVIKETFPVSHSVNLTVYQRSGGAWVAVPGGVITQLTDDLEEVDLTRYITTAGQYRLSIQSAAGQPQGGRLGCDVAGFVMGAIQGR